MALAYYEYTVRSGDSLSRIIYDMYSWNPERQPRTYADTLKGVLALNPHITDPDRIRTGIILRLPEHPTSATLRHVRPEALRQQGFVSESLTAVEKEQVTALAWLAHNSNWLTVPGSIATGSATAMLNFGNRQLLTDISNLYADYKRGGNHTYCLPRSTNCKAGPVQTQHRSIVRAAAISEKGCSRGDAPRDQATASTGIPN